MTTVREIIEAYLAASGYDGLFGELNDEGCGCRLCDLIPCDGENFQHCQPGYVRYDGPGGHQWSITAKREKDAPGEGPEERNGDEIHKETSCY